LIISSGNNKGNAIDVIMGYQHTCGAARATATKSAKLMDLMLTILLAIRSVMDERTVVTAFYRWQQ
jgi:hypothetical protein